MKTPLMTQQQTPLTSHNGTLVIATCPAINEKPKRQPDLQGEPRQPLYITVHRDFPVINPIVSALGGGASSDRSLIASQLNE